MHFMCLTGKISSFGSVGLTWLKTLWRILLYCVYSYRQTFGVDHILDGMFPRENDGFRTAWLQCWKISASSKMVPCSIPGSTEMWNFVRFSFPLKLTQFSVLPRSVNEYHWTLLAAYLQWITVPFSSAFKHYRNRIWHRSKLFRWVVFSKFHDTLVNVAINVGYCN